MDDLNVANEKSLLDLPNELLEFIMSSVSVYRDLPNLRLVCTRLRDVATTVLMMNRLKFDSAIESGELTWSYLKPSKGPSIAARYLHSACYYNKAVYIFGGCSSSTTCFNDTWKFDLVHGCWERLMLKGTYPPPKSWATLVPYKGELVLYGGCSYSLRNILHQQSLFFDHTFVLDPMKSVWRLVNTTNDPEGRGGHQSTIINDKMFVFGGSCSYRRRSNEVWMLDLKTMVWLKKSIQGPKPISRTAHSQILLDDRHVLIMGGYGGNKMHFCDVWLLTMSDDDAYDYYYLKDDDKMSKFSSWFWTELKVGFQHLAPQKMWGQASCKVNNRLIILGKWCESPSDKQLRIKQKQERALKRCTCECHRAPLNANEDPSEMLRDERDEREREQQRRLLLQQQQRLQRHPLQPFQQRPLQQSSLLVLRQLPRQPQHQSQQQSQPLHQQQQPQQQQQNQPHQQQPHSDLNILNNVLANIDNMVVGGNNDLRNHGDDDDDGGHGNPSQPFPNVNDSVFVSPSSSLLSPPSSLLSPSSAQSSPSSPHQQLSVSPLTSHQPEHQQTFSVATTSSPQQPSSSSSSPQQPSSSSPQQPSSSSSSPQQPPSSSPQQPSSSLSSPQQPSSPQRPSSSLSSPQQPSPSSSSLSSLPLKPSSSSKMDPGNNYVLGADYFIQTAKPIKRPCVRPNSMNDRAKQLQILKSYEEIFKNKTLSNAATSSSTAAGATTANNSNNSSSSSSNNNNGDGGSSNGSNSSNNGSNYKSTFCSSSGGSSCSSNNSNNDVSINSSNNIGSNNNNNIGNTTNRRDPAVPDNENAVDLHNDGNQGDARNLRLERIDRSRLINRNRPALDYETLPSYYACRCCNPPSPSQAQDKVCNLHVLNFAGALADGSVQWQPVVKGRKFNGNEPVFYSLVDCESEICMFGGLDGIELGVSETETPTVNNITGFLSFKRHIF